MLDQIEMALRRYEQIAPSPGNGMTQSQATQLTLWLERQVGPIVAALLSQPGFRRNARWPIDCLTGDKDCAERNAVLAVDQAIVTCATSLSRFARLEPIWNQLISLRLFQSEVPEGDPNAVDPLCDDESLSPTPQGLRQIEFVARRPWHDLVSVRDYFRPISQFNLVESFGLQRGEFLPYSIRQLRQPGDFITRCMEIRVSHWQQSLRRFFMRCQQAYRRADCNLEAQWNELNDVWTQLAGAVKDLHRLCQADQETRLSDSSIGLLQIYAGFHQHVDFSWLGEAVEMVSGVSDISYRVAVKCEWDVPERAAAALIDIADFVRQTQPHDELIKEMKLTKRLVLIEEQRDGFLDGQSIDKGDGVNWHGPGSLFWEMVWTLAEQAQLRKSVDTYGLRNPKATEAGDPLSEQAIKDRRRRLKQMITPELDALIASAGSSTYRLQLEPDDICLLGWFSDQGLEVLSPQLARSPREETGQCALNPIRSPRLSRRSQGW